MGCRSAAALIEVRSEAGCRLRAPISEANRRLTGYRVGETVTLRAPLGADAVYLDARRRSRMESSLREGGIVRMILGRSG
jgi:hypothetical protein